MCVRRGSGVSMITDVLYSVNMYICFCIKRIKSCYGHCAVEVLLLLLQRTNTNRYKNSFLPSALSVFNENYTSH